MSTIYINMSGKQTVYTTEETIVEGYWLCVPTDDETVQIPAGLPLGIRAIISPKTDRGASCSVLVQSQLPAADEKRRQTRSMTRKAAESARNCV